MTDQPMGLLCHVLTGQARPISAKSGISGIFKEPRKGPVYIGHEGLAGDIIVDRKHHGGPDQAVYLMGTSDLEFWAKELGQPVTPGLFGENLVIENLSSGSLVIGDVLRVGGAVLQITAPRIPCATLAARLGDPSFPRRFLAGGHPGAYARVLQPGAVEVGETVTLVLWDGDRITVGEALDATARGWRDGTLLARLLAVPAHYKMHEMAAERAP